MWRMFAPPLGNGKTRPTTLASSQFGGSAVDEHNSSGSWGPTEQNSPPFNQGRGYAEVSHYSEHDGLPSSPFFGSGIVDTQPKKVRKVPPGLPSSVYVSTSGEEYGRDPSGYPGSKPSSLYPASIYMQDGLHSSSEPWASPGSLGQPGYPSVVGNSPHLGQPGSFAVINPQDRMKHLPLPVSPQNYPLHGSDVNSSLSSGYHSSSAGYSVSNHTNPVNGTDPLIGRAHSSIYPSDPNSSNFSSNPTTPVGSPQSIAAASQWPRVSSQSTLSPNYEGGLHALNKMEDHLEEAILVLRNHAVGSGTGPADVHGLSGSLSQTFPGSRPSMVENQQDSSASLPPGGALLHGHRAAVPTQPNPLPELSHQPDVFTNTPCSTNSSNCSDIKREDKDEDENSSLADKSEDDRKESKVTRTRTRWLLYLTREFTLDVLSNIKEDEEDVPLEMKAERERERRMANNARERLRVRDINEAFKELGRMCQLHLSNEKPQTKLLILHQAVNVILNLEQQVRGHSVTDEGLTAEEKEQRDRERRMANNARERVRVRDINEAFRELGRMCQAHLKSDKAQTKLIILQQAVQVILSLEKQVRERNLNPKAACLKRREEEKVSGVVGDPQMPLTGGHNPVGHIAAVAAGIFRQLLSMGALGPLHFSCSNMFSSFPYGPRTVLGASLKCTRCSDLSLTNSRATSSALRWDRMRSTVRPVSSMWTRFPSGSQQAALPREARSRSCMMATPTVRSSRPASAFRLLRKGFKGWRSVAQLERILASESNQLLKPSKKLENLHQRPRGAKLIYIVMYAYYNTLEKSI
ncbi:hypothetical protein Z043_109721 [Scleropages formosus]|uniref:Transcription factor E2-alpha n=1 Tax=Scleropages formosus TaxID=113540 RepID=A0A0P7UQE3_SCLFO|nr:hypothetical protein Z043_109721 [Scleropages formosus]